MRAPDPKSLALGSQPLLEGGFGDIHAIEERALVQGEGCLECGRRASTQVPLELEGIHGDRRGLERDRVSADGESGVSGPPENPAQVEDGLPEAVSRALLAGLPPQQAHQRVPTVGTAGTEGQVREQGLRLLRGKGNGPRVDAELEAAEHGEAKAWHGCVPPIALARRGSQATLVTLR